MTSRTRTALWIFATALIFAIAIPLTFDLVLYQQHLAAYAGQCGPHATDIPAYPCSYERYASTQEWLGGLGVPALIAIDAMLGTIVFVLGIAIGSLGTWLRGRRAARAAASALGDVQ